jgi:uncharacterized protein (TIGR01777 family)
MPGEDRGPVVITGSSGLVGTALVAALKQSEQTVVRLVRRPPSGAEEARWDPGSGTLDPAVVSGARAVVHLAGAGIGDQRWTPQRRAAIRDSRIRSTELLARTMVSATAPPPVWVSGSAIGIYGDRGDEELDEHSDPGSGFLADVCRAWEDATAPAAGAGVRVVHLRTGVVLSRAGGALARQLPLFRLGLGGKLGDGRQWLSWIAMADEVGAILHAIATSGLSGPVNATAPTPARNADFTAALGAALHRSTIVPAPRSLLRLALGGQLTDEALLASQRVHPNRLLDTGYHFVAPELTEALRLALAG